MFLSLNQLPCVVQLFKYHNTNSFFILTASHYLLAMLTFSLVRDRLNKHIMDLIFWRRVCFSQCCGLSLHLLVIFVHQSMAEFHFNITFKHLNMFVVCCLHFSVAYFANSPDLFNFRSYKTKPVPYNRS